MWSELLSPVAIKPTDSFVALGGDSMSAARLLTMILEQFEVEISIEEFFASNTLASLSELIAIKLAPGSATCTQI